MFSKALWAVDYVVDALRAAAGDARHVMGETMPMTMPGQISMSVRKPLGVIAGIAPFNSPLLLSMKKIAYALATGNTFGDPRDPTTVIGPLIRARQCDFIDSQMQDAAISDEPHVPFGGVKNSGFGREGGHCSLDEPTEEVGDAAGGQARLSVLTGARLIPARARQGSWRGWRCAAG